MPTVPAPWQISYLAYQLYYKLGARSGYGNFAHISYRLLRDAEDWF